MTAFIAWIVTRTGLGSLLASVLAYALIAALAGGGFWAWSAHKYNAGYSAGETHERQAWEKVQKEALAKQAAQKAADQARIDQIEADYRALQERLNSERAEAALEEAIRKEGADTKPVLPKSIARALNGVR